MFTCIYFPVWIDVFGTDQQKSPWLTTLQVATPAGIVVGYALAAVLITHIHVRTRAD